MIDFFAGKRSHNPENVLGSQKGPEKVFLHPFESDFESKNPYETRNWAKFGPVRDFDIGKIPKLSKIHVRFSKIQKRM